MLTSLKIFFLRKQMTDKKFKEILEISLVILQNQNRQEAKEKGKKLILVMTFTLS